MAMIYIKNGQVILNDMIVDGATVAINGGRIAAISRSLPFKKRLLRQPVSMQQLPRNDEVIIDAKGCFVSPGFIDCHIHGEPEKVFFNEARHGTTAFVIAESCAPLNFIYKRAESIKEFIRLNPFGPNVLGLRLEGPYISKAKAGAQNASYIRRPDAKELSSIIEKCAPILRIMTIAPELKEARPLIRLLRKHKIISSIGHSGAAYESAIEGIDAGITHATHIFNAMSGLDRREPGVVGAVLLDDRVVAEIILDLIHVHKALFALLLKLKKKDNVIIVTDSLASEIPEGVRESGGAYRFEDGRLAGSSLTMIQALKNAVRNCNVPLPDALKLITQNPAKLLGVEDKKGSISVGKDADIVIFDREFDVKATVVHGKIVYEKKGFICAA